MARESRHAPQGFHGLRYGSKGGVEARAGPTDHYQQGNHAGLQPRVSVGRAQGQLYAHAAAHRLDPGRPGVVQVLAPEVDGEVEGDNGVDVPGGNGLRILSCY